MKKILLCFFVLAGFLACEKDGEFLANEDSMLTQQSEYALQAEELLNQLTPEQRELLSAEDVTEFKKGPQLETQMRNQSHHHGTWHPVLAFFNCYVNESSTMGEGQWFGFGPASIEIDAVPDPDSGFEDGNFVLTNPDQAKLIGPYRARPMHNWGHTSWQRLKGDFETGTQIFFYPHGNVRMLAFFHPSNESLQIFAIGWVKYGLADPPVPLEFEEHFTFDALFEHYVGLKDIPGAEPMYVKTFNEFWIYPTEEEGKVAAPGIGQGEWLDNGPVTFVVDQTLVGNEGAGRWRLYDGQGENYQSMQYMEFCHDHFLGETGGTWPFELVGGSEAYFNQGGRGTGVWIGLGAPTFGNTPDNPLLLPFELKDDGLSCESYGSTDCVGFCNPGPGVPTLVYIIAYRYPLSNSNCMSVADNGSIVYSPDAATVTLPDGTTFTGGGVLPGEINFGPYNGMISSAGYKQFMTPIGQVTLGVSLFDDGEGNMFWASNIVIGFPISPTEFQLIQKHTIVGGTGDFEDVRGMLRIQGVLDVTTLTINYSMTGEMCL